MTEPNSRLDFVTVIVNFIRKVQNCAHEKHKNIAATSIILEQHIMCNDRR